MLRFSDSKNTEKLQGLFLCSFFYGLKSLLFPFYGKSSDLM